jgi:SpoVK/Ycf46/Vps4 family AAA+-type ATPase
MTPQINNILEINNQLNGIVSKRKITNEQIVNYTNQIIVLEKQLADAKTNTTISIITPSEIENQISALQVLVQACHLNNTKNAYDIDAITTIEQNQKMDVLLKAFTNNASFKNVKDKTDVTVQLQNQEYIKCLHQGLAIETASKNKIIIYPTITLAQNAQNNFYIVPTSDVKITFFEATPNTTTVASQTQNALQQNEMHILIDTIFDEKIIVADADNYNKIQAAFTDYQNLLSTLQAPPLVGIKKIFFENIVIFGNEFSQFISDLQANTEVLSTVENSAAFKGIKNADAQKAIETMALIDLLKCFNSLADITDANSNETFSMLYLVAKQQGINITQHEDVLKLNSVAIKNYFTNLKSSVANELEQEANLSAPYFVLAPLLATYNKDLHTAYLSHLYKYASIVIKADGKVTRQEEDLLSNLFAQKNGGDNFKSSVVNGIAEKEKTLEQLIYELYDLTGLNSVKAEINTLISLIKIQKARETFELTNTKMSLHLVFTGNPGTGKTTVARFIAKIYKNLGVLKQGHLIETDRSGMIAEYTGQTAIKVNKLVDSALNGVLFIDEAYAMMIDKQDAYGKEAIATLLKRMEDDRDKLIVILAGYTTEMEDFINTNPGLQSRFSKYIHFNDYTADELYSIFIGMSRKLHFKFNADVMELIRSHFQTIIDLGDKNFGNGRYVRNFFEKMIERQAQRLANDTDLNKEKLTTFIMEDLPDAILN